MHPRSCRSNELIDGRNFLACVEQLVPALELALLMIPTAMTAVQLNIGSTPKLHLATSRLCRRYFVICSADSAGVF
jgi:hypothetical protein